MNEQIKTRIHSLMVLALFSFIFVGCEPQVDPVLPTLTTNDPSNVTATSATLGGNYSDDGGASITERGICWNTSPGPTISNNKASEGKGTGSTTIPFSGLIPGTTYYARAYATNNVGTAYGNEVTFTTPAVLSSITTAPIMSITSTSSLSGGTISVDGGGAITARGVCWGIAPGPTINNTKTTDGTGLGNFVSSLTALTPGVKYYVRAYATNSAGTAYGNEVSFTTLAIAPPITTTAITLITAATASSGGNITTDGGAAVTARGICWSTATGPTIANAKTSEGSGIGTFTSSLTGLSPGTKYYVRAYATNGAGTAYGNEVSFTTTIVLATVTTKAFVEIGRSSGGEITSDGGGAITARGVCWGTTSNPTIALTTKTSNGTGVGSFVSSLSALNPGTKYYIRAYATNSAGTAYGNEVSFTIVELPIIALDDALVRSSGATITGHIQDGGATIQKFYLSVSLNPNPMDEQYPIDLAFVAGGSFISDIFVNSPGTKYYVRAFAVNSVGMGMSNVISFTSQANLPTVIDTKFLGITATAATFTTNITSDGGSAVTARGVCWNTSVNPTIANSKSSDGTGTGGFTSTASNLTPNTTYYVRGYATNSVGTAYSGNVTFKTLPTLPADADGNTYTFVTIGTQTWFAENLKTTKYNDGTPIPLVTDNTVWTNLTTPGYCWYSNDAVTNKNTYGALYNWYTVNTGKLCPIGWHVPTDAEWTTLTTYLGGPTIAGGKLKETGISHWNSPNSGATNSSSFTALPSGYRLWPYGYFQDIGLGSNWWSATDYVTSHAYFWYLKFNSSNFIRTGGTKQFGLSIRCLKN